MLTANQIAKLRERLLEERARLRQDESTLSPVREADLRAADPMDAAEANVVQHEAIGRATHDRTHLADIERALAKIEAGTYGVSEISGEAIGYARLDAVPWARFTAVEQEDSEQRERS